jgi:SHS2 domain-containing protein
MHRWVDHTSEVELRVSAATREDVFAEASVALGEQLGEPEGDASTEHVSVSARDPAGLLAAWLEELVFLSERDGLIPVGARGVSLTSDSAAGEVECRSGQPSYLVKAVTYHRLSLEQSNGGWSATVVFDV